MRVGATDDEAHGVIPQSIGQPVRLVFAIAVTRALNFVGCAGLIKPSPLIPDPVARLDQLGRPAEASANGWQS